MDDKNLVKVLSLLFVIGICGIVDDELLNWGFLILCKKNVLFFLLIILFSDGLSVLFVFCIWWYFW